MNASAGHHADLGLFWRLLAGVQHGISVICNLAIVLIVVTTVCMRYFLHLDFFGAEEVLMVCAFWLYFIGAANGSFEKSHIEASLVEQTFGGTVAGRLVAFVRDTVELVVIAVLAYWSWLLIRFAIDRWPVTPGWGIPVLVPQSAILAGFCLMLLHAARHYWLAYLRPLAGLVRRAG